MFIYYKHPTIYRMRRKVVKQGKSSLTVSLPTKWIKKNKVNAKDELEATEQGNKLVLTLVKQKIEEKKKTVNIDGMNKSLVRRYLNALCINGVTEITFTYTNSTAYNKHTEKKEPLLPFLQGLVNQIIGISITQQDKTKTTFKILTNAKPEEFEPSLNRAISILIQTSQDIISAIQKDDKEVLDFIINFSEINLNRTIIYAHNILNIYGRETNSQSNNYFLLLNQLEEIGDRHLDIIRLIKKEPPTHKDLIPHYQQITQSMQDFKKLHTHFTNESATKLYGTLENTKKEAKKIKDTEKREKVILIQDQMKEVLQFLIALNNE